MHRLTLSVAILFAAFNFFALGTARARIITPDITFTSAKVTISHDSDAMSGSPDDTKCANPQYMCDQFSLSAAFTVNGGDDLLADLSA